MPATSLLTPGTASLRIAQARWRWGRLTVAHLIGLALLAASLLVARSDAVAAFFKTHDTQQAAPIAPAIAPEQRQAVEAMTVDDTAQIVSEGESAIARNAEIPLSKLPLQSAHSFVLAAPATSDFQKALLCMTQAVYYEAGFEPLAGKQAVAQVVLNRMRHPAYPDSVCGAVYEGSQQRTGCQFSFTCDGSLLKPPAKGAWDEARRVANAALTGYVDRSVGTATHYHADYVLPRWAYQLAKITQIGHHIFYRFNGAWGRAAVFRDRYAGDEQIPAFDYAALRERLAARDPDESAPALAPGLTVPPDVTDRHTADDVGGRLDVTKQWRLTIPDPTTASANYRATLADTNKPSPAQAGATAQPAPVSLASQ